MSLTEVLGMVLGLLGLFATLLAARFPGHLKTSPDWQPLPTPLCLCDEAGRVLRCNDEFARYLQRPPAEIRGRSVFEVFRWAAKVLANEGALAAALADWDAKFVRAGKTLDHTYHCPPYQFGLGPGPSRYHAFWFRSLATGGKARHVLFGINYLRGGYEMDAASPGAKSWHLGIRLEYTYQDIPFRFSQNDRSVEATFAALEAAGPYVCVGSSALRIHGYQLEQISSLDVVVPDDGGEAELFVQRLCDSLGKDWRLLPPAAAGADTESEGHSRQVAVLVSVEPGPPALRIAVIRRVGRWTLDAIAAARRRTVRRGAVVAYFSSLEDAIVSYVDFDEEKERTSVHRWNLREMVRALVLEGEVLHRDELERSAARGGLAPLERQRAVALFERVSEAERVFRQELAHSSAGTFDVSWEQLLARGQVPRSLSAGLRPDAEAK